MAEGRQSVSAFKWFILESDVDLATESLCDGLYKLTAREPFPTRDVKRLPVELR